MGRETRVLTGGIYFGEGPRWRDGRLWFSDFYAHAVKSVSLAGDLRTEVEIDDQPSGLGWMPDGSLLIVSMTRRQVLRRTPDGKLGLHADLSHIATFHCNDMVVDAAGGAYVGNFGFDLDTAIQQRGVPAVLADHPTAKLAYVSPDGQTRVAAEDMHFPNGPVITPDGKTLILGETLAAVLTAFDIGPNGDLSNRRVWAPTSPAVPDGICLDADGAIWVASPSTDEALRVLEGGEVTDRVKADRGVYACMLGGSDRRTLYLLTAKSTDADECRALKSGRIEATEVAVPGAGLP